ncbi:MAG: HemK2/MTQ2 family protein methyltransferase [Promethearchaeota archaeon]
MAEPKCQYWDFSTLLLKKALDKYVRNGQTLLEIGAGHLAILSIYIAKKRKVDITAVDINPIFVQNARKTALKNNVKINIIQSNLFEEINNIYDCIFFNPPYVPTNWMIQNHKEKILDSIFDLIWNGGVDGCVTIQNFLKKLNKVAQEDSIALLGVNSLFISVKKVSHLIQECGFSLKEVISSSWNPSRVYVIQMEAA